MNDVVQFMNALRAAVPVQPDPRLGAGLVPRLAAASRAATLDAETKAARRGGLIPRGRGSRLASVARIAIVVAAIPLLLAGIAFAGVTLPQGARDAFERVGVDLPNQPSKKQSTTSPEQSTPAGAPAQSQDGVSGEGNSTAAHQHALEQRQKAKGKGKALGHDRGKAIGLHEAIPPGHSGDTGPPAHSKEGGSSSSRAAPGRLRAPGPPRPPRGRSGAHGH